MEPILKYKQYHTNNVNVNIHKVFVPVLLASAYALLPEISLYVNMFYTANYMLLDVFSKKSIYSAVYLQVIYGTGLILVETFSYNQLLTIHGLSWILQIIGHKFFEKNSPAFLDNLYDSFLFAPYFVFLETFYPDSFKESNKCKINIIVEKTVSNLSTQLEPFISERLNEKWRNKYKKTPTVIYFAGLFQKSDIQFKPTIEGYNHIFVNMRFSQNNNFADVLSYIADELKTYNIECVVGYSAGGSMAKQFREIYYNKTKKDIHSVLISPGGFVSNTFFEKFVQTISPFFYWLYKTDKWFMISQYPLYQNEIEPDEKDIFILSNSDYVHSPKFDGILLKNLSHENIITYFNKQKILNQLIESNYDKKSVKIKDVSSRLSKLIFGGHFYPYHIGLWSTISLYYTYFFISNNYALLNLVYGFLIASSVWTFTEYIFHRFLLHFFFYTHHKKHHEFPNKYSIIHTPMSLVVLNWFLYLAIIQQLLPVEIRTSYYIFFPINYLAFEYTHLLSHSYTGNNNIILNARQFHRQHHFTPNTNYSFVTPFWDYLFGTLAPDFVFSINELVFGFLPFYSFMLHPHDSKK